MPMDCAAPATNSAERSEFTALCGAMSQHRPPKHGPAASAQRPAPASCERPSAPTHPVQRDSAARLALGCRSPPSASICHSFPAGCESRQGMVPNGTAATPVGRSALTRTEPVDQEDKPPEGMPTIGAHRCPCRAAPPRRSPGLSIPVRTLRPRRVPPPHVLVRWGRLSRDGTRAVGIQPARSPPNPTVRVSPRGDGSTACPRTTHAHHQLPCVARVATRPHRFFPSRCATASTATGRCHRALSVAEGGTDEATRTG